jgi:hypothetical protein
MPLHRLTTIGFCLLLLTGSGAFAATDARAIGIAAGDATLFEGATVQTDGYSRIRLNNGTRLDLGSGSRAQVFADRVALESGMGEIQGGAGYEIDVQSFRIQPSGAASIARVKVGGDKRVFVTALNASVSVLNEDGLLVARVNPGLPLSFLPQSGASAPLDATGCVVEKGGAAILVDSTGSQVTELRGADLRKAVGNMTHVTGIPLPSPTPEAAGGASQVVRVTGATVTKKGGCSALAAKLGATTAAAGLAAGVAGASAGGTAAATGAAVGTAAGLSTTTAVAIGVAGAAAAGIGSAAAVGAFSTTSP